MVKVTVLLMTCNHERYIEKALDSALAQVTSFPFEILVSEDDSRDRTRDIVRAYAARHPQQIRLILSERNIRSNEIVARGLRTARGDYVALLDGDDFWTATDKLQFQADYLDSHPDCSVCVANAYVVGDDGDTAGRPLWTRSDEAPERGFREMLQGNPFATNTAVLRRAGNPSIGEWYSQFFLTDWPVYLHYLQFGRLHFIDRPLGAYRLHRGGMFSPLSRQEKLSSTADFYRRIADAFPERRAEVRQAGFRFLLDFAWEHLAQGDRASAVHALGLARRLNGVSALLAAPELARLGLAMTRNRPVAPVQGSPS